MESSAQTQTERWTRDKIQTMLDNEIQYKNWRFVVQERSVSSIVEHPYNTSVESEIDLRLRAEWMGEDAVTRKPELQQSRWWPLSVHMVKTEIIQTAFLCVLKAEEHEIRETFLYTKDGQKSAPFNSHIHIDELARASHAVDIRVDTRTVAPKNQRRE